MAVPWRDSIITSLQSILIELKKIDGSENWPHSLPPIRQESYIRWATWTSNVIYGKSIRWRLNFLTAKNCFFTFLIINEKVWVLCGKWLSTFSPNPYVFRCMLFGTQPKQHPLNSKHPCLLARQWQLQYSKPRRSSGLPAWTFFAASYFFLGAASRKAAHLMVSVRWSIRGLHFLSVQG